MDARGRKKGVMRAGEVERRREGWGLKQSREKTNGGLKRNSIHQPSACVWVCVWEREKILFVVGIDSKFLAFPHGVYY